MATLAGGALRTRWFRLLDTKLVGLSTLVVVVIVAALASMFSEQQIRLAIIASSMALLFGALAAWLVVRPIEQRLRKTVTDLKLVEGELERVNRELETRVGQRTAELIEANSALQAEMTRRAQVEVELRQAQKLEAVGSLASGIAHEINTPVQFVSDSCSFLETATADLIAVIAAYCDALRMVDEGQAPSAVAAAVARVRELEVDRDLAYLIEQIPLAIGRTLQGLSRVSAIVHAMKEFAYPDRREQVPADLNRAILSTLTVARNEYKYVAEVKTELGELPPVTCHIGELNQVVLNMVINAAHAIAEAQSESERPGLITVRSRASADNVEIEIEDNGCGIPTWAIERIFDPFFTTKEIGKGTGQGLAIARSVIVEKHAGKIDVTSRVGHGTTFTIVLPANGRSGSEISGTADDAVLETAASRGQPMQELDDSSSRRAMSPSASVESA